MKSKNDFSVFLKNKRIAAGHSQKDVADKLGYSTPQFISNWERGISQPPVNSLKRLADLYNTSADELFEVALATTIQEVSQDLKRKFANSKVK